jgi:phenylalanyl-tRNA synthetase alpha chain
VQLQRDLGLRDLSEPAEGPHAIQVLIGQAVERLCRAWECEVRWCRGPRIVPVADNYDRLGYRAGAITRETRYTRYVDAESMLRSHSSAMIPPALRRLARQPGHDVLLACPGIVYRRDAIDWQHTGTPHQLDLWRISGQAMSSTDMDQMIAVLLRALAPGLPHRQQPRTHPYTLDGRQVDVYHDGHWVEIWECGLAHPNRVRDALGADTSCVEEVRVLSVTACQQLPASAIGRLGAKPGQKNLLVRVVLRDLEKTLTNQTANALRDRIYRALHQGTEHQWAG